MAKTIARKITIYVDGRETEATLERSHPDAVAGIGADFNARHHALAGVEIKSLGGVAVCNIGPDERAALEVGAVEVGSTKVCVIEVGAAQIGAREVGAGKVLAEQVGAAQVAAGKVGAAKIIMARTLDQNVTVEMPNLCLEVPDAETGLFLPSKQHTTTVFTPQRCKIKPICRKV